MSLQLAYKCKFCGALGTAECAEDCPEIDKAKWLPLLCCNRCGSYQAWLVRVLHRVSQWARDWSIKSPADRQLKAQSNRAMLEEFTRQIARVMCRFHRVEFSWSHEFVDELLAHPEVSQRIVRSYESGLRWKARGSSPKIYHEEPQ